MINDRRRFWATLIFIGIFVPFVALLVITMLNPATRKPADARSAAPDLTFFSRPRPSGPIGSRAKAPILVAGDIKQLLVVHPFKFDYGDGKSLDLSEVLYRRANSGAWSSATYDGNFAWNSFPQAVAFMPHAASPGSLFVLNTGGFVDEFQPDDKVSVERLPATHVVKAAAASLRGLFAITYGVPPATATRPGDPLSPFESFLPPQADTFAASQPPPATAPTVETAPATTTATSAPATLPVALSTTTAPAAKFLNAYWLKEGRWLMLPPLSRATDSTAAPAVTSLITLATLGNELVVLWVDPTRPGDLMLRTLDTSLAPDQATWSPPTDLALPANQQIPAISRLMSLIVDNSLYVFWSVPTGQTVQLCGGRLTAGPGPAAWSLPERSILPPMSLGTAGRGIAPDLDVAVGTSENSIVAIVQATDGNIQTLTFSARGEPLAGPVTLDLRNPQRDVQLGQNIMLILILLVFSLSLWQWRQRPIAFTLPAGMVAAPLHLRGIAFAIDIVISYVAVVLIFGAWDTPLSLLSSWSAALGHPEEFFLAPDFLAFIGLYLLHVSVGELFFRKSVGKALTGIQVLMTDGRSPTLVAVILRNFIRLPEAALGFVVVYLLISEHRQRLGDLIARTVVVSPQPPEVPPESDSSGKKR